MQRLHGVGLPSGTFHQPNLPRVRHQGTHQPEGHLPLLYLLRPQNSIGILPLVGNKLNHLLGRQEKAHGNPQQTLDLSLTTAGYRSSSSVPARSSPACLDIILLENQLPRKQEPSAFSWKGELARVRRAIPFQAGLVSLFCFSGSEDLWLSCC